MSNHRNCCCDQGFCCDPALLGSCIHSQSSLLVTISGIEYPAECDCGSYNGTHVLPMCWQINELGNELCWRWAKHVGTCTGLGADSPPCTGEVWLYVTQWGSNWTIKGSIRTTAVQTAPDCSGPFADPSTGCGGFGSLIAGGSGDFCSASFTGKGGTGYCPSKDTTFAIVVQNQDCCGTASNCMVADADCSDNSCEGI